MDSYDVHVYQQAGRWHFQVLQLMKGSAGASTVVIMSHAENRYGYATKEEANQAGLIYKAKLSLN